MSREEIYQDIQEIIGLVPTFFKHLPDTTLELEWKLFRAGQLDPGAIPNKYRELIGLAIAGIMKCHFCAFFHAEMAKLNGATDAEIEDAVHFAKSSAGWSAYVNGLQLDFDQFKREVQQACEYVRSHQALAAAI